MSRLKAVLLVFVALSWPAASQAQQQLDRPGTGMPTFEAPPPAPEGVREKTDALMESVSPDQRGVLATQVVTRGATVEAIDHATQVVTLRDDDGVTSQKKVAPDVDLTQVEVGDHVTVKEIASVAVDVTLGAVAKPPERTAVVETAEPGEKPARLTVETEQIVATVAALNYDTHTATLRNPDGSTRTILVDPRVDFDKYHVGDQVTLTLTKAIALSVDTPD